MLRKVLSILLCLYGLLTAIQAQDSLLYRKVSFAPVQCTLDEAIRHIERQTSLSFSYNSELFDKRKPVNLEANEEPLIDLLNRLFNDRSLNFGIIDQHLVVYRTIRTSSVRPDHPVDSVDYFIISGKVFGNDSKLPLPFASVYLVGKPKGIICNEQGEFELKLSQSDFTEELSISCIGYKNFKAPVSSLLERHRNYFLETDIVSIQEVIIRKISPDILLENANKKVRLNYPSDPSVLTSFYRESIKRGSNYNMVSEAIIHNFKAGYGNSVADRVKIIKGRKNESFKSTDTVMLKLKAGLNTMLLLDVVKNIPDFMIPRMNNEYNYRMADIVIDDGRDNYAVEFRPAENSSNDAVYSGRIIIDINDLAFKWIEFQVNPEELDRATENFIIRKPSNLIVKALKASYKVAYRKTGNKYYLHMIQCETAFKIRNKKQLSGSVYTTKLEMAVMEIDTINVNRFPLRESAHQYEFFTDQLGTYDEAFWGEYNFIKPDESLEKAIIHLSRMKEDADEQKN